MTSHAPQPRVGRELEPHGTRRCGRRAPAQRKGVDKRQPQAAPCSRGEGRRSSDEAAPAVDHQDVEHPSAYPEAHFDGGAVRMQDRVRDRLRNEQFRVVPAVGVEPLRKRPNGMPRRPWCPFIRDKDNPIARLLRVKLRLAALPPFKAHRRPRPGATRRRRSRCPARRFSKARPASQASARARRCGLDSPCRDRGSSRCRAAARNS